MPNPPSTLPRREVVWKMDSFSRSCLTILQHSYSFRNSVPNIHNLLFITVNCQSNLLHKGFQKPSRFLLNVFMITEPISSALSRSSSTESNVHRIPLAWFSEVRRNTPFSKLQEGNVGLTSHSLHVPRIFQSKCHWYQHYRGN